jgi:DNA-binding LacI/PurR family transcriptional regulator
VPCAYSLNGSRPLALELLSATDRPTAMFCMSDSIAYGVCVACAELGLVIPDDVSVAGFGEHPISRLLAPPLTSTSWDVERVAQVATGFLVDALEDERPDQPRRELFPPRLVPRASTGPPPV